MKVVVCQGETTGYPSRDELVALWKEAVMAMVGLVVVVAR